MDQPEVWASRRSSKRRPWRKGPTLDSHITALSLHEALYVNRAGKVIVPDGCDNLFRALARYRAEGGGK